MQEYSLYGKGLDWPFDYDALRPCYDQVQAKGFAALDMHTSPIPMAILSRPYKGRQTCIWDGWCDAGCPTGALANPLVVYFPRAQKAGAVMQADSHVTRVLADKKGNRVTGVEYFDATGNRRGQLADVVVLAAFTIENPRILLNSATDEHPRGLANSSNLLGRYLMSHPSVSIFGMFDEDMQNYLGATGGQLFNQDGFAKEKGAFGSHQWEGADNAPIYGGMTFYSGFAAFSIAAIIISSISLNRSCAALPSAKAARRAYTIVVLPSLCKNATEKGHKAIDSGLRLSTSLAYHGLQSTSVRTSSKLFLL